MLNIILTIDGKEKKFRDEIRLKESLRAYELYQEYEKAAGVYSPEQLETIVDFIVECWGGQFTREQLLDGYKGSIFVLIPSLLGEIIQYVAEKIRDFPTTAVQMPQTKKAKV